MRGGLFCEKIHEILCFLHPLGAPLRGSSAIGGEGVSVEKNFREETCSRALTYLVLSFVSSDNKREVSRKWSALPQGNPAPRSGFLGSSPTLLLSP